jgi:cobalt-precorrin 5A hydrolase
VRYLDGLAVDKRTDPAVVVLDEAARFAVSLLAGHEGGANALAYRVAELTGAVPVITTATEALKPLVLGIGCRKGVNATQIDAAVAHALAQIPHGAKLADVREVATVDLKADEPGLREWCAANALPVRVFSRETLAARNWVASPSDWVRENIGLDGVCEPCALLAAPRSKLILPKTSLNGVTVAIAEELV